MFFLHRISRRCRLALLSGLICAIAPLPTLASVVPFEGVAKWVFSMEVTEHSNFGTALSSGPAIGDSANLSRQSAYTGKAFLDYYEPGRHDWHFEFAGLNFSRGAASLNKTAYSSDMPPSNFDQTHLPGNLCGFVINYCHGALAKGGEYEAVRYGLDVNTLILPDGPQRIDNPANPISFTFTERLIFSNKNNSKDLQFFTAKGASWVVLDDTSMSVPVPGALVSLGSAMALLVLLSGPKRRRV